jgi:AraC-like DNA-binding protein
MSLQLPSTIDSLAGKQLRATTLRQDLRDGSDLFGRTPRPTLHVRIQVPSVPETGKKRAVTALPKWRLMRVLSYIETNIGEPITLANLAATTGLSRMYFAKQFRATTGIRPHDFVLRKRIERAQQQLAATSDALVDIALSVGFQTQAHFTTVFKRIAGSTPYQWRREQPKVA